MFFSFLMLSLSKRRLFESTDDHPWNYRKTMTEKATRDHFNKIRTTHDATGKLPSWFHAEKERRKSNKLHVENRSNVFIGRLLSRATSKRVYQNSGWWRRASINALGSNRRSQISCTAANKGNLDDESNQSVIPIVLERIVVLIRLSFFFEPFLNFSSCIRSL